MVTALPRPVQIKLEQTLAQWHQWRTDTPLTGKPEKINSFIELMRSLGKTEIARSGVVGIARGAKAL